MISVRPCSLFFIAADHAEEKNYSCEAIKTFFRSGYAPFHGRERLFAAGRVIERRFCPFPTGYTDHDKKQHRMARIRTPTPPLSIAFFRWSLQKSAYHSPQQCSDRPAFAGNETCPSSLSFGRANSEFDNLRGFSGLQAQTSTL